MSFLNANIPVQKCFVRGEYLLDHGGGHGTYYPCMIFAVASLPGQVPLFHSVCEDGGIYYRLPVNAFCHVEGAPHMELHENQWWNSFSYHVGVFQYSVLGGMKGKFMAMDGRSWWGNYLFTLDWCAGDPNTTDTEFSEVPGEHKCGHVLELGNGNYAISPNNKVLFNDPSFTTKFGKIIPRKIHSHTYSVEAHLHSTEDSDNFDYRSGSLPGISTPPP